MTAHAYEPSLDEAADHAADGEVVYLTRRGRWIAVVPGELADEITAREDAEDTAATDEWVSHGRPRGTPWAELKHSLER